MLLAEQDHPRHQEIEIGGAERARPAHPAVGIAADAHEVDVGLPVDLAAAEEEGIDPALRGAVEQLAPAVGERVVALAAEDRDPHAAAGALARQERRGAGDRRGGPDRDVAKAVQHSGQNVDQQLLRPPGAHSAGTRSATKASR